MLRFQFHPDWMSKNNALDKGNPRVFDKGLFGGCKARGLSVFEGFVRGKGNHLILRSDL